jgi:hypothetical protein
LELLTNDRRVEINATPVHGTVPAEYLRAVDQTYGKDHRDRLPLRLERRFRPWSYQVTQRRLELRSKDNFDFGETVYVVFLDVVAMQIRYSYDRLDLAEATDLAVIEPFTDVPERHRDRFIWLSVGDHTHQGFVVCAAFAIRTEAPAP